MAAPPPLVRDKERATTLADPLALDNAGSGVLPADVLHEILLRVPAKALCRLRLVCRSWRSLTSDRRFATAHSSRNPMIAGLRDHGIHGWIQIVDVRSGKKVCRRAYYLGLGFLDFEFSTQGDLICATAGGESRARILDPITGVINILPKSSMDASSSRCILGHVPSTGEYKVLPVDASIPPANRRPCQVITLAGSQRWKTRPDPSLPVSIYDHMAVGGVVYFLLELDDFSVRDFPDAKHDGIVAFDLATEEWRPAAIRDPFSSARLVDANGKIAYDHPMDYLRLAKLSNYLVTIHYSRQYHSMDFWFLVHIDKGHWTKRYTIPCQPYWNSFSYPLAILDDGRIFLYFRVSRVLRAYDPRLGIWTDLTTLKNYVAVSFYEGSLLVR